MVRGGIPAGLYSVHLCVCDERRGASIGHGAPVLNCALSCLKLAAALGRGRRGQAAPGRLIFACPFAGDFVHWIVVVIGGNIPPDYEVGGALCRVCLSWGLSLLMARLLDMPAMCCACTIAACACTTVACGAGAPASVLLPTSCNSTCHCQVQSM